MDEADVDDNLLSEELSFPKVLNLSRLCRSSCAEFEWRLAINWRCVRERVEYAFRISILKTDDAVGYHRSIAIMHPWLALNYIIDRLGQIGEKMQRTAFLSATIIVRAALIYYMFHRSWKLEIQRIPHLYVTCIYVHLKNNKKFKLYFRHIQNDMPILLAYIKIQI